MYPVSIDITLLYASLGEPSSRRKRFIPSYGIRLIIFGVGLVGYRNSGASWAIFSICMDTNSWKKAFKD
jgi:hypothetical protein